MTIKNENSLCKFVKKKNKTNHDRGMKTELLNL